MPGGENKSVAVGPVRVLRIVAQKFLPKTVGQRRHRHRRAGMSGIGSLHGVHGKRANGVDARHLHRIGGVLNGSTGFGYAHPGSFVAARVSLPVSARKEKIRPFRRSGRNTTLVQKRRLRKWSSDAACSSRRFELMVIGLRILPDRSGGVARSRWHLARPEAGRAG